LEKGLSNDAGALGYSVSTDGKTSNASQLYILMVAHKELDGKNTAFGKIVGSDGLVLANQLTTDDSIVSIAIVDTTTTPTVTPNPTPEPTSTSTPTQAK
jgi:cyclophilin family peptidyl-prolyl cis-trans isomerase